MGARVYGNDEVMTWMKTHDIGGSTKVTIPSKYAKQMGIKPKCRVQWNITKDDASDKYIIFIHQDDVECPEE